ncbi:MAG: hypothetical protein ACE1S7_07690, partial [Candidatus Tisiphia sp.]
EQEPILAKQYENIILQEKEIKTIQDEIDAKTKIIKQSKQKEEQLFEELKQLEQKSYPPLSSAKQQEGSVSQYSILQERANDAEASVKRQIEINKLNEQLKIAQGKIDDQDHQLQQLKSLIDTEKLSAEQESKKNLERISELQERIRELEGEKEEQQQSTISHGRSWADELQELGESDGSLSDQIDKLTSENDKLRAKLEATEKNAKEQLEVLSGEKELEYKAKENYAAKLQEATEKLSELQSQLQLELQQTRNELEKKQEELNLEKLTFREKDGQNTKLEAKLADLNKVYGELQNELNAAQESHAKEFNRQSELAKEELQKSRNELDAKQQLLEKSQEELLLAQNQSKEKSELTKKLQDQLATESEQAKKLQTQVTELTNKENELMTKLAVAEQNTENQKGQIDKLTKEIGLEKNEAQAIQKKAEGFEEQLERAKVEQVAVVRELNEKLSVEQKKFGEESNRYKELQIQLEAKSDQADKLQAKLDGLTNENANLNTQLQAEKNEKKELVELSEAKNLEYSKAKENYAAKLQEVDEELSQLKLEQQKSWSELEKKQQELIIVQESLKAAEQEYGVESKQAKELQAQLGGLTNENNSLKTQLEEIENERKQLEVLSGKKDLKYNYLEAEYEKQQAELKKIQQELTEAQEKLTLEKLISDEQYDQNKNFKTQLNKVTDENAGLKSQLEKRK